MALTHTQGYKDNTKEESIFRAASRLINLKEKLVLLKYELLVTTAAIAADSGADADLKTLGTQSTSFINNSKITDFISFVASNLE